MKAKWTEEMYQHLMRLKHAGFSYAECADELNKNYEFKVTKNSCISIANRREQARLKAAGIWV